MRLREQMVCVKPAVCLCLAWTVWLTAAHLLGAVYGVLLKHENKTLFFVFRSVSQANTTNMDAVPMHVYFGFIVC
jgi:hypothetical protein